MGIDLKKKQPFDLTKKAPGLKNIVAGLGWDTSSVNGKAVDCDVSVFMLGSNNKIPGEGYFVFYNNLQSEDASIVHTGDSRDGEGDDDDEAIEIDLPKINSKVVQIVFIVTIHEAAERRHHFGNVNNAFIRIYNKIDRSEICRYTLAEQFNGSDSLLMGRMFRDGSEWKFEAMGDAFSGGLAALLDLYA